MIPPFPPRGNATIRVVRRAVHDIDVYKEAAPDNLQRVASRTSALSTARPAQRRTWTSGYHLCSIASPNDCFEFILQTTAPRRSETIESERERLDRQLSQFDPDQPASLTKCSRSAATSAAAPLSVSPYHAIIPGTVPGPIVPFVQKGIGT